MKVPSPRDGMFWRDVTVRRILVDETHLGRIIANKTGKWKRSKGSVSYVTNKKEDWIVREGCHEAVKTIEEHDKIMIEMNKRKRPAYAKDGKFTLAGLIKCSKCGKTMSFKEKKDDYPIVYRCRNFLEDGITKCGNLGGSAKILIEEIHRQLYKYKDDIEKEIKRAKSEQGITSNIHNDIFEKEKQIEQLETDLESVDELVIAKYFTPQEAIKKKQKILQKIEQLEIEINTLNMQNQNYENMTNTDRVSKIEDLLNIITDETMPPHKINRAYKSIIHSIIWEKETEDELSVTVNFL
jgi:chromosome segregation ATPase